MQKIITNVTKFSHPLFVKFVPFVSFVMKLLGPAIGLTVQRLNEPVNPAIFCIRGAGKNQNRVKSNPGEDKSMLKLHFDGGPTGRKTPAVHALKSLEDTHERA